MFAPLHDGAKIHERMTIYNGKVALKEQAFNGLMMMIKAKMFCANYTLQGYAWSRQHPFESTTLFF